MLNNLFTSDAFAQASDSATAASTQDFSLTSFVPLVLIFVIFYFLIIRPQSKKMKDQQEMVNGLKSGNKVITSGGIVGVVKEVHAKDDQVEIEVASGVNIRVLKHYVTELVKDKNDKVSDKKIEQKSKKK